MTVPGVQIETPLGLIRGQEGPVQRFLGIPYAAAPTGERRWRPPIPVAPWTGVLDATRFAPDCPQAPGALLRGSGQSEDCLALNIWVPETRDKALLPVMVWLHGGGFTGGSGSDLRSDGTQLASAGMVVVSVNYRTGIFGWLAHPDFVAESDARSAGNYGLLDQIEALRWVRSNIARFGGNPNRVTVFGCSAGSASIALLLLAQQARGLFSQAILQSPGACRPLCSLDEACKAGVTLAATAGDLRERSTRELLDLSKRLIPRMRGLTTPRLLRPIRDGALISQDEWPALQAGDLAAIPLMIGTNADEGTKLTADWTIETTTQWRSLISEGFGLHADQALSLYPVSTQADVRPAVAQIFGDTQFNHGADQFACAAARANTSVWRYLFRRRRPGAHDGPHHGDEVAYVFGNLDAWRAATGISLDDTDFNISRSMQTAWTSFARDGKPKLPQISACAPQAGAQPDWPVFTAHDNRLMVLDTPPAIIEGWRDAPLRFLEELQRQRYFGTAPTSQAMNQARESS
jgi:para-nitrobenzyl esterase